MISESRFDYAMAGVKKRVYRSKKTMEEKMSELQRMIDRLDKTKEMLLHEMKMVRKRAMENKKDLYRSKKTMEEKMSELQRMIDRLDKTKEMLLHEMKMVRKRAMENKKDLHFAEKTKRS